VPPFALLVPGIVGQALGPGPGVDRIAAGDGASGDKPVKFAVYLREGGKGPGTGRLFKVKKHLFGRGGGGPRKRGAQLKRRERDRVLP